MASSLERMDRLREAALQRLEQKVVGHETAQSKFERRVSELSGKFRGLSEEMQVQIKSSATVDSRLSEMLHQLEDTFQKRCTDIETLYQEMSSKHRVATTSGEEAQKRLQQSLKKLEGAVQERTSHSERLEKEVKGMQERMGQMEEAAAQAAQAVQDSHAAHAAQASRAAQELAVASRDKEHMTEARLWEMERQLVDMSKRLDQVDAEAHGDSGWDARLKEHEVRMSHFGSKLSSTEEHYKSFDDRFRSDWESRFQQLQKSVQGVVKQHLDDTARLEALAHHAEGVNQALEDIRSDTGHSVVYPVYNHAPYQLQVTACAHEVHAETSTGYRSPSLLSPPPEPYFGLVPPASSPAEAEREELVLRCQAEIDQMREKAQEALENHAQAATEGHAQGMLLSGSDIEQRRADDLEERLGLLISQLKDVVPKVVEHEDFIRSAKGLPMLAAAAAGDADVPASSSAAEAALAAEAAEKAAQKAEALAQSVSDAVGNLNHFYENIATSPWMDEVRHQLLAECKSVLLREGTLCNAGTKEDHADIEELSRRVAAAEDAVQRGEGAAEELQHKLAQLAAALPQGGVTEHAEELTKRFTATEEVVNAQLGAQKDLLQKLMETVGAIVRQVGDLRAEASSAVAPEVAAPPPAGEEATDVAVAAAIAAHDEGLNSIFSRVAESESECTRIQQQLQQRINNMDEMLDRVAAKVLHQTGDPQEGLPAPAVPVAAALLADAAALSPSADEDARFAPPLALPTGSRDLSLGENARGRPQTTCPTTGLGLPSSASRTPPGGRMPSPVSTARAPQLHL